DWWCTLWLRGVARGRGPGFAPGRFPRISHRPRRAPLDATGSPRLLPSGWFSSPGIGDLVATVAVPGDRDGRDPPQFDLSRRDGPPAPGGGDKPSADVFPPPAVPFPQHADYPPPGEVVQHGEDVLGDRVPEVVSPAVHDLVQPGQHVFQVLL